jgi:hypothetical protein
MAAKLSPGIGEERRDFLAGPRIAAVIDGKRHNLLELDCFSGASIPEKADVYASVGH